MIGKRVTASQVANARVKLIRALQSKDLVDPISGIDANTIVDWLECVASGTCPETLQAVDIGIEGYANAILRKCWLGSGT